MDKTYTIIRIYQLTATEFECEFNCDLITSIEAASLILTHVLKHVSKDKHELVFRALKDYIYNYVKEDN